MKKKLSLKISAAAVDYAAALLEACQQAKVSDPVDALINTDYYPKLQKIICVEWIIGWFHGVAESHNLELAEIWDLVATDKPKKRRAG